MKKKYLTSILILICLTINSKGNKILDLSDEQFIETIGKSQVHLQKIPIIYINLLDGKEDTDVLNKELLLINNHLKSLKSIVKKTGNRGIYNQLKNVTTYFKDFKKITSTIDSNNLNLINKQQTIMQFQLNSLFTSLNKEFSTIKDANNESELNFLLANEQLLNLNRYKFNQKMFINTSDVTYLIDNKDLLNELNEAIDKLIVNSSTNSKDEKLSSLNILIDYMQYNEAHMKSIVDDASYILESIRDEYICTNVKKNKKTKVNNKVVTL